MPFSLVDYFQKQGLKVVEAALQNAVGKAVSSVTVEAHYQQYVVQRAWEHLPLPIRVLMKKDFARWAELFLQLRDQVYDLSGDTVSLRPNAPVRITALNHAAPQEDGENAFPIPRFICVVK